jgi:predicted kinase
MGVDASQAEPAAKQPALVHLMCGATGSGKTTFARQLARAGAVHLNIDEWMLRLYGRELPRPAFEQKLAACFELLIDLAGAIARAGTEVVLDAGFWHKQRRVSARGHLAELGLTTVLHVVSLPDDERWRRLERRNQLRSPHEYEISREMFEAFSSCFEPPGPDESPVFVATSAADG